MIAYPRCGIGMIELAHGAKSFDSLASSTNGKNDFVSHHL